MLIPFKRELVNALFPKEIYQAFDEGLSYSFFAGDKVAGNVLMNINEKEAAARFGDCHIKMEKEKFQWKWANIFKRPRYILKDIADSNEYGFIDVLLSLRHSGAIIYSSSSVEYYIYVEIRRGKGRYFDAYLYQKYHKEQIASISADHIDKRFFRPANPNTTGVISIKSEIEYWLLLAFVIAVQLYLFEEQKSSD